MKRDWNRMLVLVMWGLWVSVPGATAGLRMYSEGGAHYTVLAGDAIYFELNLNCWGPNWAYFSIPGSATVVEGTRALTQTAKISGTEHSVRLQHQARQASPRQVALRYELTPTATTPLTQISVAVKPAAEFFRDTVAIVELADGKRQELPLPFRLGNVAPNVQALVFQDRAGRETRLTIQPPLPLSLYGEGRIELATGRLETDKPAAAEITLSWSEDTQFFADDAASVQRDDTANWFPYPVGSAGVPVDLSFLNRDRQGRFIPAGAHGFVRVKGDGFEFADGTPVRFWGVNCTAAAVLGSEQRAVQLAERLARLGCNVVRLHHLDSWANPIIDYDHPDGTTQNMNPRALRLLDRFVFEMKQRGIYTVLDPWVQRCFKPGDGVADYGRLGRRDNFGLHPYIYFDARMQELIQKQWEQVWTHVNEFTGVAYKDEPAIALTEVINEGLLTSLSGVTQPVYQQRLRERYEVWAKENHGLPWEAAKVIEQNYGRNNIAFMRHLHESFYRQSYDFMRRIGIRVPITMNNWSHWTWIVAAQAAGDFMDFHHYYGGDMVGPGAKLGGHWVQHAPHVPGTPFGKFAAVALPGKPVMSSECGHNPPATDRATYLLGLAAVASFQGWDAFTGYAYSQSPSPTETLGAFEWESDPAMIASLAAGALVFRRGDVQPAREKVVFQITEDELFALRWEDEGRKQYWNTPGFNANIERHKMLVCLPGQDPAVHKPLEILDVERAVTYSLPDTELRSDTGELWRDWAVGGGTLDTPRTQAAYGNLGRAGREWKTRDCVMKISTPVATVALSSLTDEPLRRSGKLLLTAVARAQNTGTSFNLARNRIVAPGRAPVLAQPVTGTIRFQTNRAALTLYPIRVDGTRAAPVPIPVQRGEATLELRAEYQTIFYEIEAR